MKDARNLGKGDARNSDNEAELRLRQLLGESPGPEQARQEARVPAKDPQS